MKSKFSNHKTAPVKDGRDSSGIFTLGLVLAIWGVLFLTGGVLLAGGVLTIPASAGELAGWILIFAGIVALTVGLLIALSKKSEKARLKLDKFRKSNLFPLVVLLLIIIFFFQLASPNFAYLKVANIRNILSAMVLYTLLSIAVGLLIIFGEIDLSPGYTGAVPGVILAAILAKGALPWYVVIVICLLTGVAFGLLNAVLVNELKIQSFIATLATGSFVAGGLTYIVVDSKTVFFDDDAVKFIFTGRIGGVVPITIIIALLAIVIYGVILAKTKFGRSIYLCGGNRDAARLAGINPKKISYILFINSGFLGAVCGVVYTGRIMAGNLIGPANYTFPAITAAILGGFSFGGGTGNMLGCFLGLAIMNGFNNGLIIMSVSPFWQSAASGAILLLALTVDYFSSKSAMRIRPLKRFNISSMKGSKEDEA